ncbi:hypothetical protein SK128_021691 [Halocaridina rubra]|uniref:Uncharacterized protein n=1 Tax=Halocaridina rubra TaxID=373956 RepID=A0AAN8ZZW2_HALRR
MNVQEDHVGEQKTSVDNLAASPWCYYGSPARFSFPALFLRLHNSSERVATCTQSHQSSNGQAGHAKNPHLKFGRVFNPLTDAVRSKSFRGALRPALRLTKVVMGRQSM